MAVNSISSSRISTPLEGIQAANQRETRANRDTQRAQQASQTERASSSSSSAATSRAGSGERSSGPNPAREHKWSQVALCP